VIDGVRGAFAEIDGDLRAVNRFVHGTTVATNTVITRTGARVGLVTTEGFRDILEIAYQTRPSLYDATVRRPAPLILRDHIYEVSERLDAEGQVLKPVEVHQLEKLANRIKPEQFDVVVVAFLNSYLDPTHEDQVVEHLRAMDVAPFVFASSDISPEMREYDRFSTAAISAYVQPKIAGYLRRLEQRVAGEGVPANMWIMQSNGGLLSPEDASRRSARTILSGLAGGVVGAANWSKGLGLDRVVSFDIGGTSTDIALIRHGEPDETISGTIDDMPIQLPSVDVHTIGAGGGSIAWLDSGGGMRVGPQSAGSVPGPVSYQRGGTELTVTDAHAVLGRLGENLLGGRFKLDIATARRTMAEWGAQFDMSAEDTAEGILRVITATMARGIRKVSVERGIDVRTCHLMSFGGAGPLHGADLSRELGMKSAIIPPHPGIASAVGMLDAPVRQDFSAPTFVEEGAGNYQDIEEALIQLEAQGAETMPDGQTRFERYVDARYIGQSYELTVPYLDDPKAQRDEFDRAHAARYGFSDPDARMEIVVARVVALQGGITQLPKQAATGSTWPEPVARRNVYIGGEWFDVPVFQRADIAPGAELNGPLIIEQLDTTVFVRPLQTCRNDEYGFLYIEGMEN
jgi:N-methylhydantoinase A